MNPREIVFLQFYMNCSPVKPDFPLKKVYTKFENRAVLYCCISREIKKSWNIFNFFRRKLSETNQIAWMQNFARNNF